MLYTLSTGIGYSQSEFDADTYKLFLNENKSLTCTELLESHQPKTIYYSDRNIPTGLNQVAWFDSIDQDMSLTDYEKQLLARNHFVVTERLRNRSWAYSFINLYSNDLPLFISSDFVLHTMHKSYDAILVDVEYNLLEPNLIELLNSMYYKFGELYSKYGSNSSMINSLQDVDLYIAVANSLARGEIILPIFSTSDKYDEVMAGIESEQMEYMSLFTNEDRTRKLDFSQFKPRGHYTKTIYTTNGQVTLENYFRAMMWLGRIDFLMTAPPDNPWEPDWTKEELQRMQISALLLNELLNSCGKRTLFETHEKIISFMVGPDDNLTPDELTGLADELLSSPEDILSDETYELFTEALNSSDDYGQKIMSNFFYVDPDSSDPGQLPVSYKLLGQKFLLDSYVTSEVVYDRISWNGTKIHRGLPDPLDVMAALGNENAMALMQEDMEKYHYAYKLSALENLISYYHDDYWNQSLYNVWLSSIRTLNPPSSTSNLPYFMKTVAWHHEKLNTQLTSWAELRHDNILYGKQSYTGGTGCSYPYTYVEPYPELYQRIETFSQKAKQFFSELLGSDNSITTYYENYGEVIGKLGIIAQKELDGELLNDDEITFLKTMISNYMASGPSITGWFNDLFYNSVVSFNNGMTEDFIVADIHTQPTDEFGNVVGYVYHVGTGYVDMGIFLAPNPLNPDQLMTFAGPVSSYRYDITEDFYRYNDEEWFDKFWSDEELPARPDWVWKYLANYSGEAYSEGRGLDGITFIVTGDEDINLNSIDYLLTFPNPTKGEFQLRFIMNESNDIQYYIYTIDGKLIANKMFENLKPGEHKIPVDIAALNSGYYLIKFLSGNQVITKKVLKE